MRPGSPFLRDLARDADALRRVHFVSLWTPLDLIILPARSSVVATGDCRRVWCAAHPLMVLQPSCQQAVALALDGTCQDRYKSSLTKSRSSRNSASVALIFARENSLIGTHFATSYPVGVLRTG